ncbi:CHASE domain-containing protein [Luteimonas sp. BDR2-5]|uniref:CHASE domain-containing protein n=1 Tax=Proluteimonas luteida TaxID=2878685 RepID=UPI001E45978A|nr:CHASE domain-containing protein [Luteimonas sp. BDR2-5]MCD9026870.1 CHASE domain-containing protein [Luteimonas sp. BDR2-5]
MSAPADSLLTRLVARARRIRRGHVLAGLVLVGSLLLVVLYAQGASERERRLAEASFVADAEQLAEFVRQRLLQYELSLRGGVALHGAAVESQVARQWRGYVEGLDVERRLPGLMGLGFVAYLDPPALRALQLRLREESGTLFTVTPRGVRDHYGVVVYFEPEIPDSHGIIGFDSYSDPLRRAAMDAARDSGEVRLSAPVRLYAPGTTGSPGVLMYAPVYRGGPQPQSMAARHAAISGWVYAPFRSDGFLDRSTIPMRPDVAFRIVDVAADGSEQPVLASSGYLDAAAHADDVRARVVHSIDQTVYGRSWRYDFQRLAPVSSSGMRDLQATLLAGVLASVLLFAVVLSLAHTQSRAETLAHRLSASYRRSEQRFRNAMQYSAIGMVLLDRNGAIAETNPAMAEIAGVSQAVLTGTWFHRYFVDGNDEPGRTREQQALREGVYRTTRRLRRRDGDIREVHLASTLLPGEHGSDVVRLVQVEDVTERVRAEAQVHALNRTLESRVEQRTRELTQANHELESFAYIVSHDLRAPLRSIEGFGRLLSERYHDAIDAQGRDYLSRVRNAANRMDALIDALLAMSRITRGGFTRARLDISALAEEVVGELRQDAPGREVEVVIAPGLTADGDAALVRNLLQNLIGNAWKFTSGTADARIELGCEAGADGAPVFFVRDNGAGFNADYAGKLFRPFQRLHREDEYKGHGVGLASVKRIVERHGGRIWADGRPGEGAVFRFTLGGEAAPGG